MGGTLPSSLTGGLTGALLLPCSLLAVGGAVFAMKKKKKGDDVDQVLSLPAAVDGDIRQAVLEPELVSMGNINLGGNASGERQEVLGELIDNQPDEVAQLLRGWLGDRRETVR